jgi:signal transduction histidine kinase/CheY-like chemotaxis protein
MTDAAVQVRKLLRQQAAIARFGSFALRERSLEKILTEGARVCAEGLDARFGKVCRYRVEHNDLLVVAGYGWRDGVVGHVVSRADMSSPQGRAFVTTEPAVCGNLQKDIGLDLPPFYAEHGIISTVDVIIKGSDAQPYGILEIDSDKQQDYDQYDINYLTGFANVLAEAVSTAARGEALQSSVDQMKSLVEEKDRLLDEMSVKDLKLRQTQKMEAIGQLTGGVAHDMNNILTVIIGSVEILTERVAPKPELVAITKMIDQAAERGSDLTKRLLAFARKQALQPREVDVNLLVLEAIDFLRLTLGEHIEVHAKLAASASHALIDPSQLTNALLNLAINARDAMPGGGSLIIETSDALLDGDYVRLNSDAEIGNYVLVTVTDSGQGISAEHLGRVFEPFFTTKDVDKGSGLGLSMIYGFVKQSNGHIKIYSEQGHGTTVRIYLPEAGRPAEPAAMAPSQNIEGGHETILIVEDDPLVRAFVVGIVESFGYVALTAVNAVEALAYIKSNSEIDLLFTDMILPGVFNGRQLAEIARQSRPLLKVLFTSGYSNETIIHNGHLDADVLMLTKPYRRLDLSQMIRTALAG